MQGWKLLIYNRTSITNKSTIFNAKINTFFSKPMQ